jgi:uncharacterized protein
MYNLTRSHKILSGIRTIKNLSHYLEFYLMQLQKPGIRVLGIAESFSDRTHSCLCGVVMRRDLHIDGFVFGKVTVGGEDATEEIIRMVSDLDRRDLNLIMLNGCVIAWYNIINPAHISTITGLPVICASYEESEGLDSHIEHHFPGNTRKISQYRSLGYRIPVLLTNGYTLYARGWGISDKEVIRVCSLFTHHGKIPEPLRVARLCARSIMKSPKSSSCAVR